MTVMNTDLDAYFELTAPSWVPDVPDTMLGAWFMGGTLALSQRNLLSSTATPAVISGTSYTLYTGYIDFVGDDTNQSHMTLPFPPPVGANWTNIIVVKTPSSYLSTDLPVFWSAAAGHSQNTPSRSLTGSAFGPSANTGTLLLSLNGWTGSASASLTVSLSGANAPTPGNWAVLAITVNPTGVTVTNLTAYQAGTTAARITTNWPSGNTWDATDTPIVIGDKSNASVTNDGICSYAFNGWWGRDLTLPELQTLYPQIKGRCVLVIPGFNG